MYDLHLRLEDEARFADYLARRGRERKEKRVRAPGTPRRPTGTATNPRRRAGATEPMVWLRSLTFSLVYGEKTPDGIRPSNTKEQLRSRWNLGHRIGKLANYRLADHFAGKATYYFFGSSDPKATRTLVMIDIDVGKSLGRGSRAGAEAFARHLKARWPGLYCEPSTGGEGVHAYLVIDKSDKDAGQVNAALKRLQDWLRAEAERVSADIELVEVKGTCPVIEFEAGGMTSVRYGTFAKLPRDASRFGEWQGTTALSVDRLNGAEFDMPSPCVNPPAPTPPVARRKPLKSVAGSSSGRLISQEEVDALPRLESFARSLTGGKCLKAGRWAVTDQDVAVALLLLRFFHKNPNPDGTLPTERVSGMWAGLYEAGDVGRTWNHHRWKAIRDFLSASGHIDWTDHRYYYGYMAGDKFVKGRACKFTITGEFASALDRVVELPAASPSPGGASFMDTKIAPLVPQTGRGYYRVPVKTPMRAEAERIMWSRAFEACEHLCAA